MKSWLKREGIWWKKHWDTVVAIATVAAAVGAICWVWIWSPFDISDKVQMTTGIGTLALVIAAAIYAWHTRKQADASVKMAEEMWKDRQQTSRPIIVIECCKEEPAFEIFNDGRGPAVNLEISVLDKAQKCLDKKTVSLLRAQKTMEFSPDISLVNQAGSIYYLLCRYWTVLSKSTDKPPYKTGLSFKMQDKAIVSCSKLLFGNEAESFAEKL